MLLLKWGLSGISPQLYSFIIFTFLPNILHTSLIVTSVIASSIEIHVISKNNFLSKWGKSVNSFFSLPLNLFQAIFHALLYLTSYDKSLSNSSLILGTDISSNSSFVICTLKIQYCLWYQSHLLSNFHSHLQKIISSDWRNQ